LRTPFFSLPFELAASAALPAAAELSLFNSGVGVEPFTLLPLDEAGIGAAPGVFGALAAFCWLLLAALTAVAVAAAGRGALGVFKALVAFG
jgi:hypothetical protein